MCSDTYTQLRAVVFPHLKTNGTHPHMLPVCRVAPEHRLVPGAALDWECLAASVQLLVSLEARDHEARLNLRRNTQYAP